MGHFSHNKYQHAWFVLAKLVAHGKKQEALGVYKLLERSFENVAYAMQLKGDILLTLKNNDEAVHAYEQAAFFYQAQGDEQQALAVCQHILLLQPASDRCAQMISALQQQAKMRKQGNGKIKE